jgi:hypothetical protein
VSAREGTPLPSGPMRFGLEAGFIVLVGAAAAVFALSPIAIAIVMGLAWVAVVLVERAAKATRPRPEVSRVHDAPLVEEAVQVLPEPEPARRLHIFEPRSAEAFPGANGEWNLWELERRARERAGADAVPEEWAAIFMHLREFANSDGRLPAQFDSLVRESFPDLTRVG